MPTHNLLFFAKNNDAPRIFKNSRCFFRFKSVDGSLNIVYNIIKDIKQRKKYFQVLFFRAYIKRNQKWQLSKDPDY